MEKRGITMIKTQITIIEDADSTIFTKLVNDFRNHHYVTRLQYFVTENKYVAIIDYTPQK